MSLNFLMQLDFAQSKNWSQHARAGSTSVLTLPHLLSCQSPPRPMRLEVVVKTRLVLLEDFLVLLLGLGDPGLRWMFSEPDLLQRVSQFHLRLGGVNTSFALSLFA